MLWKTLGYEIQHGLQVHDCVSVIRSLFGPIPEPLSARHFPFRRFALDDESQAKDLQFVHYVSTRGAAPALGFADALLTGLARDGGLYAPDRLPEWRPADIRALRGLPYAEAAVRIMTPFVGDAFGASELEAMTVAAYAGFRHAATAPVVQLDVNLFALELFHGPTLAFKDFAMQWLGRAMNRSLSERGTRATILGATSGDTGAAAIEAFAGQDQTDIYILYPHGRVSGAQRRQMTTVARPNVHALAVEGTFDDCQRIVKELFGDLAFRDEMSLSGVNSINWARIQAQIVYYFWAAVALGAPERAVSFAVPTGNFGDVLAGYYAKRMGLPVERLIVATNENDILARALADGHYEPRGVRATQSPSMDIQVSSNFERLLFEATDRDAATIRTLMNDFARQGSFSVPSGALERIRADFDAERVDEAECAGEMRRVWRESGIVVDPHSAVGIAAGRRALARAPSTPVVALGTAHPAKFPDAVERATGVRPALPAHLADLMERKEKIVVLPNSAGAIAGFLRQTARAESARVSA
jgi:threonine synthase